MTDKNNIKAENGLLHVLGLLLHLDEQRKERNRSWVVLPSKQPRLFFMRVSKSLVYYTLTDDANALTDEPNALTDEPNALTDEANALTDEANVLTDEANALTDEANALTLFLNGSNGWLTDA